MARASSPSPRRGFAPFLIAALVTLGATPAAAQDTHRLAGDVPRYALPAGVLA